MEIGILTFHAAHNYGAVLQCYALQEYLKSQGHNVYVIDYRQNYLLDCYKWFHLSTLLKSVFNGSLGKTITNMLVKKKRGQRFDSFIKSKFNLMEVSSLEVYPYDYIIIGSDQVWNTKLTNGYDQYYWGQFKHSPNTKVISYAACVGQLWPQKEDGNIKKLLSKFDKISTREDALTNKISSLLTEKNVVTSVDPTLLLEQKQWAILSKETEIDERYVLYYQVAESSLGMNVARKISEDLNCKLKVLSANTHLYNSPECINTSPEQFLCLIKNAEFVVSSSFHGTVFSIIFNKSFVSISNGSKDVRVRSLLSKLHLEQHYIQNTNFSLGESLPISQECLQRYIRSSVEYLRSLK